jgi:hypothetical protein
MEMALLAIIPFRGEFSSEKCMYLENAKMKWNSAAYSCM